MTGDVMPFTSADGGHHRVMSFRRTAAATYRRGEWVLLTAGAPGAELIQELTGAAGGTALDSTLHYLAADDGVMSIARIGDTRYVNPPNTARMDGVYHLTPGDSFITANVFAGTDAVVAASTVSIGATGRLHSQAVGSGPGGATLHGVDTTAAGGIKFTRILNANKQDVSTHGGTATFVVFMVDETP